MISQYIPSHPLTRLQSENLGIEPTKFPLPKRKIEKKTPEEFDGENLSSSSSISYNPLQSQPSTPQLHIIFQQGIGTPTSSSQPIVTSSLLSSAISSTMAHNQPQPRPWTNPRVVAMPAPLSQLPAHPQKWLPKFNLDIGILVEEHIDNFMLSINLNIVIEEDVVRLFPYTLQEAAESWYFSLPAGSITSWNAFQEQFLTKFGDDRSTARH